MSDGRCQEVISKESKKYGKMRWYEDERDLDSDNQPPGQAMTNLGDFNL